MPKIENPTIKSQTIIEEKFWKDFKNKFAYATMSVELSELGSIKLTINTFISKEELNIITKIK